MKTLTVELTTDDSLNAILELERQNLIKILGGEKASVVVPGNAMTQDEFKNWIAETEQSAKIPLDEAKKRWQKQKEKLGEISE